MTRTDAAGMGPDERLPIHASAPGKLLLLGEYAVLAGGPAVVMAVNRAARVTIQSSGDTSCRIDAPELGVRNAAFDCASAESVTNNPATSARLGLTGRLLPRLVEAMELPLAGLRIAIDTSELFEPGAQEMPVKLGLGSSAAVTAALASALAECSGRSRPATPGRFLDALLPMYREAQGGAASGADLAASLFGGCCRVQSEGARLLCRPVRLPDRLAWRAIWVGAPASTPDFIASFDAWRRSSSTAAMTIIERMNAASAPVTEQAEASAEDWCSAMKRFASCLDELQRAIGAPIVTGAHARLQRDAERSGLVYKTSGAGGGDFGLVFGDDPGRLDAWCRRAPGLGGRPVELRIEAVGAGVNSAGPGRDCPGA